MPIFHIFESRTMGGKFSKYKVVESFSMEDRNPGYQSDLRSYEAASRADPSLQDFDKTLHDRAYRVIRTLAGDAENQLLTFNSVGDVTLGLLEIDLALAKVILASKEDTCKDRAVPFRGGLLRSWLKDIRVLHFPREMPEAGRDSQLRIQLAPMHFEEERGENVGRERYVKTLHELQKFKEVGDPFTDEFSKLFHSVHNQQAEMLRKFQARKKKLDKNLKNAQAGRRVTNAIFVTAFVSFLIFSVVAVVITALPVVTALAAALAAPIGSVGKWCDSLWQNY